MSNKVSLTTPAADPLAGIPSRRADGEVQPARPAETAQATDHADLRLIIEEADEPGRYVYTIVDRRSGRIISQLPREEVLRLREQSDYAAGTLFKGEA